MSVMAFPKIKTMSVYAEVIRADGSKENRGIVSYRSQNLFKHYSVNLYIKLKDLFRK